MSVPAAHRIVERRGGAGLPCPLPRKTQHSRSVCEYTPLYFPSTSLPPPLPLPLPPQAGDGGEPAVPRRRPRRGGRGRVEGRLLQAVLPLRARGRGQGGAERRGLLPLPGDNGHGRRNRKACRRRRRQDAARVRFGVDRGAPGPKSNIFIFT